MGQLCSGNQWNVSLCDNPFCQEFQTFWEPQKKCLGLARRPVYYLAIDLLEHHLRNTHGFLQDEHTLIICKSCHDDDPRRYIVMSHRRRDVHKFQRTRRQGSRTISI